MILGSKHRLFGVKILAAILVWRGLSREGHPFGGNDVRWDASPHIILDPRMDFEDAPESWCTEVKEVLCLVN
jgi:hypothetical protein